MRQQGVTLMQLLGVLALLGVLTQLGAPAYADWRESVYQAAVARELAQSLRSARSQALLHSQAMVVRPIEQEWGQGWRAVLEASGQVVREHRLQRQSSIAANLAEVRFDALGIPRRDNGAFVGGTLQICTEARGLSQHRVVLAPSGRVSVRSEAMQTPRCAEP